MSPTEMVRVVAILRGDAGASTCIEAEGRTLRDVVDEIDRRRPGLRARVLDEFGQLRPLVTVFVDATATRDADRALHEGDTIHILGALGAD